MTTIMGLQIHLAGGFRVVDVANLVAVLDKIAAGEVAASEVATALRESGQRTSEAKHAESQAKLSDEPMSGRLLRAKRAAETATKVARSQQKVVGRLQKQLVRAREALGHLLARAEPVGPKDKPDGYRFTGMVGWRVVQQAKRVLVADEVEVEDLCPDKASPTATYTLTCSSCGTSSPAVAAEDDVVDAAVDAGWMVDGHNDDDRDACPACRNAEPVQDPKEEP